MTEFSDIQKKGDLGKTGKARELLKIKRLG